MFVKILIASVALSVVVALPVTDQEDVIQPRTFGSLFGYGTNANRNRGYGNYGGAYGYGFGNSGYGAAGAYGANLYPGGNGGYGSYGWRGSGDNRGYGYTGYQNVNTAPGVVPYSGWANRGSVGWGWGK